MNTIAHTTHAIPTREFSAIDEKAKLIKLLITDVDGVLTDGRLFFDNQGISNKIFHVHDGQGLQFLQKTGIRVAIITKCHSPITQTRMKGLGVDDMFIGEQDKSCAYDKLKAKYGLHDNNIAYIGDDWPDLPLIVRSGLGIIVANAVEGLAAYADWQTQHKGGEGAVREVCDRIMQAQNTFADIATSYLAKQ